MGNEFTAENTENTKGHEVNHRDRDLDLDRKINNLEKGINHRAGLRHRLISCEVPARTQRQERVKGG